MMRIMCECEAAKMELSNTVNIIKAVIEDLRVPFALIHEKIN